ncbi:uncharacterized protein LOC135482921 [Lineus longissimus]|uniref:uncharacterized protein LOC135482921 n=1 Tax=Lineus longissimus TaxID=88925 RepID=UPI00315CB718
MHLFSDASEKSFGASAFLRYDLEGKKAVSFLASKTHVVPLKTVSLPRLELQGAVLALRLSKTLVRELDIGELKRKFWTDSAIVLRYVKNTTKRFKPFVANRVAEILSETSPSEWGYVPTDTNPADYCTRGMKAADLKPVHGWYQGPDFLRKDEAMPDDGDISLPEIPPDDKEVKKGGEMPMPVFNTRAANGAGPDFEIPDTTALLTPSDFETWHDLVSRTAWINRAVHNLLVSIPQYAELEKINTGHLTVKEYRDAAMLWVRKAQQEQFPDELERLREGQTITSKSSVVQLSPYFDTEQRCLRIEGRLRKAKIPEEAKHQIILPGDHIVSRLTAADIHSMRLHCGIEHLIAELRQKYWPTKVRNMARRVIAGCLLCHRQRVKPSMLRMANLPTCRLAAIAGPFAHTGVDYFGPMKVKVRRAQLKRWGCLFTCKSTRAVHLELADSLETDDFLLCLRRFIGRRGNLTCLYSDNGSNFRGSDTELQESLQELDQAKIQNHLTPRRIEWRFNSPVAPHWGSAWERLVKSVKAALNVKLRTMLVSDSVLRTALCEVEAVLNSRPLTHNSAYPSDLTALTPNHFLLGRASSCLAPGTFQDREIDSRRRWRQCQVVTDSVHKRWLQEYLPKLTVRGKWRKDNHCAIAEGDLVLIVDEELPRGHWQLARVVETFPGDEWRTRAVRIKTSRNTLVRPVSKIALFEENYAALEEKFAILRDNQAKEKDLSSSDKNSREKDLAKLTVNVFVRLGKRFGTLYSRFGLCARFGALVSNLVMC